MLSACIAALAASAVAAPARTPSFRVTLKGQNHTPRAGVRWGYVVRATTRSGARFKGTAIMRVFVNGKVVDTIGWFGFKGVLRKSYRFNPVLRGKRAVLQAKVIGTGGKRVVGYSVRVR
jgi:hypothetical protein